MAGAMDISSLFLVVRNRADCSVIFFFFFCLDSLISFQAILIYLTLVFILRAIRSTLASKNENSPNIAEHKQTILKLNLNCRLNLIQLL